MKYLFYTLLLVTTMACSSKSNDAVAQTSEGLQWVNINEALKINNTEKKKYFIDVYTDWCGWCKVMDKKTFSDPTVQAAMEKKFITVKFNAEQKEAITFKGQAYEYQSQGSRGFHTLAAAMLQGQLSYPSYVYLDENLNIIKISKGFMEPAAFLKDMEGI